MTRQFGEISLELRIPHYYMHAGNCFYVCPLSLNTTGLFNPSGNFQTPLISALDGAILKSFDVVKAMIRWFNIMYHKPW